MIKKLFFLIILFLSLNIFSTCKALETNYPEINGITLSEGTSLPEVVKYIFNFSIWGLGIVGFAVLTWTGIRYLTSSGSPTIKKESIKQFKAAFLGIAILFGSYLILTTINPQLKILGTSELEKVPIRISDYIDPTESVSPDPLTRIKKLAEIVLASSSELKKEFDIIKIMTDNCNCASSSAQCDCSGDINIEGKILEGLKCSEIRCYGDPCPNRSEIEEQQLTVIKRIEEILYYRNRMMLEKKHIDPELEQFIYWGRLTENQADQLKIQIDALINFSNILVSSSNDLIKEIIGNPSPSGDCIPKCFNTYLGTTSDDCKSCRPEGCHNSSGCDKGICEGKPWDPDIQSILDGIITNKGDVDDACKEIINILTFS